MPILQAAPHQLHTVTTPSNRSIILITMNISLYDDGDDDVDNDQHTNKLANAFFFLHTVRSRSDAAS